MQIINPGSSINPFNRVSRVLGALLCFLFIDNFCLPWGILTFSTDQFSCTLHSSRPFRKWIKGFKCLWWSKSPCSPCHFSISHLSCAVLITARMFVPGQCCPASLGPFCSPSSPQLALQLSSCWCLRHQPHLLGSPRAAVMG